jgi:hypothetical protein
VELTIWGRGIDPYFNIPMPKSMTGWLRKWFYLKNDASAPLPVFTSINSIPLPTWGYRVARKDLGKLQPLRKVVQQLWQEG